MRNICKIVIIGVVAVLFTSCGKRIEYFDNIIPTPKQVVMLSNRAYQIKLITEDKNVKFTNPDEYIIKSRKGHVEIAGNLAWANATIDQIVDIYGAMPDIEIHDWAEYPFRGFMHDVGRNFQTIEMLKETIDIMSLYKLNIFNWHLTDYPAWRIECKSYPILNDPEYQRQGRDCGKYYSYEEIRDLFEYARNRGITIVPEIDMPGHSKYFTDAFGFTMDSEEGMKVLEVLLAEFFAEIPSEICPYFHLGSDEIYISDPEGFMSWAENFVAKYNRKTLAWDPGLPSSEKTIRQIWNTAAVSNENASHKNGKYVDSFMGYLNYYDPIWFTNHVYLHKACAQDVPDTTKALGGILCLWNDVRVAEKEKIALHNGMINGMMVYAERFWNGGEGTYDGMIEFEKKMFSHKNLYYGDAMRWYPNVAMTWNVKLGDKNHIANGAAVDLDYLCAENNITEKPDTAIAKTIIEVETDTIIMVYLGFDTPARSNRNGVGIAQNGKWEGGGRCFVNGNEILPDFEWKEPCSYEYHFNTWGKSEEEQPYTDEQLYWMRKPVGISLKKGRNDVEIIIPRCYDGIRWSFGFLIEK